jgi:hypothetical protein
MANCPVSISNAPGITLTRSEPFFESTFRQNAAGLKEVRRVMRDGKIEVIVARYQHPLAPVNRVSQANTVSLEYAADTAALDDLPQIGKWQSDVVLPIGGASGVNGTAIKTYAGADVVTIGTCSYDVWVVEDRLEIDGRLGPYELQSYAPSLGLIVRTITMSPSGDPLSGVEYDQITAID